MIEPNRNQNTGQNQTEVISDYSDLDEQGKAGGIASMDDTYIATDIKQPDENTDTEE